MWAAFSAAGSLVQRPCGPRKSWMPLSVLMPAPVSTTTRSRLREPTPDLVQPLVERVHGARLPTP